MYMAPVGLVNIGDADAAYAEAIDITGAHQWSYGREAAGVFAAAVAVAAAPDATVADVMAATTRVAHDGTAAAIEAVLDAVAAFQDAGGSDDPRELGRIIRAAVSPYDTVGDEYRAMAMDARLPSRTKSIEELPVALGFVLAHDGDARAAILDAANYGRDSDSIATMAGAICGGLGGRAAVPAEWVRDVAEASRLDLDGVTRTMTDVVRDIAVADAGRARERAAMLDDLLDGALL